ncbi:MAG: alkaline phosphatase family protein [Dehalococcoidia bacterium]|nr:alkaline phosphatase family protein [Dehalococcoidia bacterium]
MSADVARLLAAFGAGRLLRPGAGAPDSLDLSLALASLGGVPEIELTAAAEQIVEAISYPRGAASPRRGGRAPDPAHIVFVLVDGLGMKVVERLPAASFLRSHVVLEMRALFPTSTAPVLTSLATGLSPAEHGVAGWWSYLPAQGVTATVLPFIERFTRRPLTEFGVVPDDVFLRPALLPRYARDVLSLFPAQIAGSAYTRYSTGGTASAGYDGIRSAVTVVVARLRRAPPPTYTYLYLPQFDAAEHEHGPFAARPGRVLLRVDAALARLAEALPEEARLVISADHGQIATPAASVVELRRDDPLMAMLLAPPDGDGRAPRFHLQPGAGDAFAAEFRARFGAHYALLTIDEAADLRLFGPHAIASDVRQRFGDLQAVALDDTLLEYRDGTEERLRGNHGGLSPDEMRIPLIVA